jgi:hypothetical protein
MVVPRFGVAQVQAHQAAPVGRVAYPTAARSANVIEDSTLARRVHPSADGGFDG